MYLCWSKVILQKQFNGFNSCCFCYEKGKSFGKKNSQVKFPLEQNIGQSYV